MKAKIRLLEDRVRDVAQRLQALTRERDELRDELEELRRRLAAAEGEAAAPLPPELAARLDRIGGCLKDAIAELRAE